MARISPLVLAPPLVFVAIGALFFLGMAREDPDGLPSVLIGRPAPPLSVVPLGSEPLPRPEDLRQGRPVLVNFWASWCAPCRAEHPLLTDLAGPGGMTVIGVNYKDAPGNALGFLAELGNPYERIGADPQGSTAIDWGVYGVPETFVLDGAGRIVERIAGPLTPEVMPRLQEALARAAAAP